MTACWRCGRTDTERREVLVPIEGEAESRLLEECVERLRLDCVATRFHDRKPGPILAIYQDEYRRHSECDPPCLDLKQAAEHLIANGLDPMGES